MDKEKYINSLENLLIFMCQTYEDQGQELIRLMKEEKNDAYFKIPRIQGSPNLMSIHKLSKLDFEIPGYGFPEVEEVIRNSKQGVDDENHKKHTNYLEDLISDIKIAMKSEDPVITVSSKDIDGIEKVLSRVKRLESLLVREREKSALFEKEYIMYRDAVNIARGETDIKKLKEKLNSFID